MEKKRYSGLWQVGWWGRDMNRRPPGEEPDGLSSPATSHKGNRRQPGLFDHETHYRVREPGRLAKSCSASCSGS